MAKTIILIGCVTCKAKRLKCDETKPACQQCARRNVECGGYRKDYKWRPFGETSFVPNKPPSAPKPKKEVTIRTNRDESTGNSKSPSIEVEKVASMEKSEPAPPKKDSVVVTERAAKPFVRPYPNPMGSPCSAVDDDEDLPEVFDFDEDEAVDADSNDLDNTPTSQPPQTEELFMDQNMMNMGSAPLPLSINFLNMASSFDFDDPMHMDPNMLMDTTSTTPTMSPPIGLQDQKFFDDDGDDVEEVVRTGFQTFQPGTWPMAPVLPNMYTSSMSSMSQGSMFSMPDFFSVPRSMDLPVNGPDELVRRFDRDTCGILSVKDGPTENPWRTLIWPLARGSPALYHAIASMTSFHTSKHQPELRVQGIDHMRSSIEALATGIENMQFDTAIATTLALAFAESWDQHTSTGINHIRGAKVLVNQALTWHGRKAFTGDKLERLKFLTNAWVYMDVLARLTSSDDDESNDFDAALSNPFVTSPFGDENHIDPLMGAASTLFPIIGRVANLVRRVRRADRNSPTIISQAMELKKMLQAWDPPMVDENIEDESVEIEHSIQTAEAYRWATLLYLHQAVPEIPSESSAELGKKVMVLLATVPLSSRTVIVHIYPLMAASCEAVEQEDRQWVHDRWSNMAARMKIGIIDRCVEVVNEVWERRDQYELIPPRKPPGARRGNTMDIDTTLGSDPTFPWSDPFASRKRRATSSAFDMLRDSSLNHRPRKASRSNSGPIDHEFTVRGRLHWLSVMKDWNWEGMSDCIATPSWNHGTNFRCSPAWLTAFRCCRVLNCSVMKIRSETICIYLARCCGSLVQIEIALFWEACCMD